MGGLVVLLLAAAVFSRGGQVAMVFDLVHFLVVGCPT